MPRCYGSGGALLMWENKVGNGKLSPSQVATHAALAKLGHNVVVLRATTEDEAADKAEATVRGWLTAKENRLAEKIAA
ncbi:hypothetical protein NKI51_12285 [Mesorhizobium australicum]|uniref:hypothetical protein n=1 Tax=Mesorhizobium australicum TaxID=536018 RepID=UPI0033356C08